MAEPAASCALVLMTAADWSATSALSGEIAQRAGLPVRSVRQVTPRMFAVALDGSAEACKKAMARLAADKAFADGVEPDRRRTLPARPAPSSAQ